MKLSVWKILPPLFLFVTTFAIYLHNVSPSVYGGDVGDFVIASLTRGIAHPSGYPLFVLLGVIFDQLPIHQTPAWKVGLVSVFFSSFSVVVMYFIILELLKKRLLAVITALSLAFLYSFWLYAEVAEVFALNSFFELFLLLLGILYYTRKKIVFLYLLSFFAGLSLTNHEIIVLLFPSLFLLIIKANWKILLNRLVLIKCIVLFLLGLLPYIYIPIADSHISDTTFTWDTQHSLKETIHHIFRLEYGWHPNTDKNVSARVFPLLAYVAYWLRELPFIALISCIAGVYSMIRQRKVYILGVILLAFALSGPGYILYGSTPVADEFTQGVLERFYGISPLFFLIFLPFGITLCIDIIIKLLTLLQPGIIKKIYYKNFLLLPFFIIPLYLFLQNFPTTNLHNIRIGDDFGKDLLASLPKNSTLLLYGDTVVFNAVYIQKAFGVREDVHLIVSEYSFLQDKDYRRKKDEIKKTHKDLSDAIVNIMVLASFAKDRPIFSTRQFQFSDKKYGKIEWIPYGIVHKLANSDDLTLTKDEFLTLQKNIWETYRVSNKSILTPQVEKSLTLSEIPIIYAQGNINVGNYLVSRYHDPIAKEYYQQAIDFAPDKDMGYEKMGSYFLNIKDCKNAAEYFKKSVEINSAKKEPYVALYIIYSFCIPDKQNIQMITEEFYKVFHTPIQSFIKSSRKTN